MPVEANEGASNKVTREEEKHSDARKPENTVFEGAATVVIVIAVGDDDDDDDEDGRKVDDAPNRVR